MADSRGHGSGLQVHIRPNVPTDMRMPEKSLAEVRLRDQGE